MEPSLFYCFRGAVWIGRVAGLLPSRPKKLDTSVARVMVIYLTPHLGDSVILLRLLEQLKRSNPDTPLDLAVGHSMTQLFCQVPWLDHVYGVDTGTANSRSAYQPLLRIFRALRAYRRAMTTAHADICLLPRWQDDTFRCHYLAYLLGSERRIGWKSEFHHYYDGMLTERYSGGHGAHEVERLFHLGRVSGLISCSASLDFKKTTDSITQLSRVIDWNALARETAIDRNHPFAVIAPGASSADRRWPAERWVEVISWLREQGLSVVILSGTYDAQIAVDIYLKDHERAILTGSTATAVELITIIAHSAVFIGNDSGPGHIAGALGIPTLVIFSSPENCHPDTGPQRFRPSGPRVTYCQPHYGIAPCQDCCIATTEHCIAAVTTESVISELKNLCADLTVSIAQST